MAISSSTFALCFMGMSLLARFVFGAVTAPQGTQEHSYKFSSVAITGGGYITGIVAHPTTPHLVYVRTDIGSSYRWSPSTSQWTPLTDFISPQNVNWMGTESIALDPQHPNRLYLAQGQYTTDTLPGAFFVSDDQGATFKIYNAPFPLGSNELGRNNGERLAVNPLDSDELWMGTRTEGLWKSADRAKRWSNITTYPATADVLGIGAVFVIFDPRNEGTVYVGATIPGGLFVTKDGGETWDAVSGQPMTWDPEILFAGHTPASEGPLPMRAVLASNGALYVTYADFPGPYAISYGAFWKYDTKTSAWTDITPGSNNTYPAPYKPQAWPPGGYCGISVDAKNSDTFVVVTLDRDPGPALDSMYYSRDGGRTYKDVSQISTPPGSQGYWGHPIAKAKLKDGTPVPWLSFDWNSEWGGYGAPSPVVGLAKFGWWISSVLIYPWDSDHVMYGTGATIWATDELSAVDKNEAPEWYIQAQGIEETAVLAMMSPTGGAHLFSGLGDINGMRHADLDVPQPMYAKPAFSNLNSLDYAGQHPNVVVRVGDSGVSYPDGCGSGTYSLDNGITWVKFPTCVPGIGNSSTFAGLIALDASAKSFIWASEIATAPYNETGPYSTQDYGKTWVQPTGLTVMTGNLSADRVQAKTFYAFDNGHWYLSTDGGLSYTSSSPSKTGLPSGSGAVPIASFNTAGEIWLPLGSLGLYHSTNFGSTWTKIGPTGLVATYLSIGKAAPGRSKPALFLWGQLGAQSPVAMWRSDDAGATWVRVNDEAHQYGGASIIQGDPRVYGGCIWGRLGGGLFMRILPGKVEAMHQGRLGFDGQITFAFSKQFAKSDSSPAHHR